MRCGMILLVLWAFWVLESGSPAWGEYQAKGRRDPFVPLITADGQRIQPPGIDEETPSGVEGLVLQGVVFDPRAESYAVINGQVVRVQDLVNGMQVVKIDPTAVTLLVEGQPRELILQEAAAEEQPTGR